MSKLAVSDIAEWDVFHDDTRPSGYSRPTQVSYIINVAAYEQWKI